MTAVLMQLERLHEGVSYEWRDELRGVQEAVRVTLGEVGRIAQELRTGSAGPPRAAQRACRPIAWVHRPDRYRSRLPVRLAPARPGPRHRARRVPHRAGEPDHVARHAGARHAELTLRHPPNHVQVEISDDGRRGRHTIAGAGIGGMRERAALIGGQLILDNPPAGGGRAPRPAGEQGPRMTPAATRILVADDHAIVRTGYGCCWTAKPTSPSSPRPPTAPRPSPLR